LTTVEVVYMRRPDRVADPPAWGVDPWVASVGACPKPS